MEDYESPVADHKHVIGNVDPFLGLLVGELGEGTYGVVYNYQLDEKNYAVKIAKKDEGISIRHYELKELACVKAMDHPYIVKVVSYGLSPQGTVFMTMEKAPRTIAGLQVYGVRLKKYTYQMLCAVDYLKSNGVSHRDIKPSNILLSAADDIKLADFGLSSTPCAEGDGTTVVVSLWYRAPELILGAGNKENIDEWALACVIYELNTGRALFQADSENDLVDAIFKRLGMPGDEFLNTPGWYNAYMRNKDLLPAKTDKASSIPLFGDRLIKPMLISLLNYDCKKRPSLRSLYQSACFDSVRNSTAEKHQPMSRMESLALRMKIPPPFESTDITNDMLVIAKSWLLDLCEYFCVQHEVYYYTTSLMSTAIAKDPLLMKDRSEMLLYVCACFWIAIGYKVGIDKTMEEIIISLGEAVVTNPKELEAKIIAVLKAVRFDLTRATYYDFLMHKLGPFTYQPARVVEMISILYEMSSVVSPVNDGVEIALYVASKINPSLFVDIEPPTNVAAYNSFVDFLTTFTADERFERARTSTYGKFDTLMDRSREQAVSGTLFLLKKL